MTKLTEAVGRRGRDELCAAFDAADVPAGPILNVDEILNDPNTLARGMVREFDHPKIGKFSGLPVPFKFQGWDDPSVARPPLLGEHTESILAERLGYSPERIAQLRQAKAI